MTERYFEQDGQQVVEVGRLAYRWGGSVPLAVGDRVELPGNWTTGHQPFTGTVTALGATYPGQLVSVRRRLS